MSFKCQLKNPVMLYSLLRKDIREQLDGHIILNGNLYHRDVLVVKNGSILNEEMIYRLLKFGIRRVNIVMPYEKTNNNNVDDLSIMQIKKQMLKNEKCVIADKDGYHINDLISLLTSSYMDENNIFAVNNSIPISKLILEKQPRFVFIDLNLYPKNGLKVIKEINKIIDTKIFLTALVDETKVELIHKLKKEADKNNVCLIFKPVSMAQIRTVLLDCITNEDIQRYVSRKNKSKRKTIIA